MDSNRVRVSRTMAVIAMRKSVRLGAPYGVGYGLAQAEQTRSTL